VPKKLARATNTALVQVVNREILLEYPGRSEESVDGDDR
jgi:hypothetical protein